MSPRPTSVVFLDRQAYKRRRMRDFARGLPIFGSVLWCIPLLWSPNATQHNAATTSQALVYVFAVWILLILLAAVISRAVQSDPPQNEPADPR